MRDEPTHRRSAGKRQRDETTEQRPSPATHQASPTEQRESRTEQVSARELLAIRPESVEVPVDTEVTASPDGGDYAHLFVRARIESFQDLQALSLIPEGLREEDVRRAIAADDRTALDLAYASPRGGRADDCECHDQPARAASRGSRGELRRSYEDARRHHHPELARVHSDAWAVEVAWDSPIVAHTRYWVSKLGLMRDVLTLYVQDLTIGHNATFNVAAATKSMWLRDLRIHSGGRLVGNGSYLKVKCRSVQGNLA